MSYPRMNRRNLAFGCTLVLALVVGGGALAVHTLASPERIKAQAQAKVRAKWNRELAMDTVDVKILPRPTVHAAGVSVEGFGKAERVTTTMQIVPLLFGRVQPSQVVIEGGDFDDPKGGAGWRVDRASLDAGAQWHGVAVDASVSRNGQVAHLKGKFDDLSQLGHRGAKSHGTVDIEWGETRIGAEGDFRLDGMRGHAAKVALSTESLDDVFAFFSLDERDRTAPLEITGALRDEGDTIHLDDIHVRMGKLHANGKGTVAMNGEKPVLAAKLSADRLEWKQALVDMGHAPKVHPPSDFVFRPTKLAWRSIQALRGMRGKVDLDLASLKLGNGIELQQPRTNLTFDDDRLQLNLWEARLLGGTGRGNMRFDGTRKTVHFEGTGENLSLQRWFLERGRDHHFTGGPMQVRMSIDLKGDTWRELAASVTGPVTIRMGPGALARKGAADWEALMVSFSKKGSTGEVQLECAAANLRFEAGVARGDDIVGARSTVSRLLTSGAIDMRAEKFDLRGKLSPKPDAGVGLAEIANDLLVEGSFRHPHMTLDPRKKPAALVKGVAAIATGGLSLLATKAARASKGDTDPCAIV
ncbi:MAG TPA: AsmA family protein [Usitatibacter sp.]|nr:AsmA family protein [Usitatibacter sp.]